MFVWMQWGVVSRHLGTFLVAVGLLAPLSTLVLNDLRLTGVGEESAGYRYFYSLRYVSTLDERPWIPQGHGVLVFHDLIQIVLTAAGFPPTELYPRIDLFSVAASALPHLLTVAAFVWAVRPIASPVVRVAIALGCVATAYDRLAASGLALVFPDYVSWSELIAVLTIGLALRIILRSQPEAQGGHRWRRDVFLLGLFAGWCLAIKPTYAAYAAMVGVLLLFQPSTLRARVGLIACSGLIAASVAVALIWLAYAGSVDATEQHFAQLATFMQASSGRNPTSPVDWLIRYGLSVPPTSLSLLVWLPVGLILAACFLPGRRAAVAPLIGSLAYLPVLYQRTYWVTMTEAIYFLFAAVTVAALGVFVTAKGVRTVWIAPLAVALAVLVAMRVPVFFTEIYPEYVRADATSRALDRFLADPPGRTLFVVPTNLHRLGTVDSAIMKGGDASSDPDVGLVSPFVVQMFPDRWYFFQGARAPTSTFDFSPYTRLVFVSIPEYGGRVAAEQLMEARYRVPLDDFDCTFEQPVGLMVIEGPGAPFYATEWRFQETVIVGCVRSTTRSARAD